MEIRRRRQKSASFVGELWQALAGMWSLLVGLWVTGGNFCMRQVTVHYPRKGVTGSAITSYRGHIELIPKPNDPEVPKCVVCMMCVKVCPSGCIAVKLLKPPKPAEGEEAPKVKPKKMPEKFTLNYNLCSLCGLCVQNCPAKSLKHSNNVYLAGFKREDFEFDLMARLRSQARAGAAAQAEQG